MKRTMKFSVNGPTSTLSLLPASFAPTTMLLPTCDMRIRVITSFDEFDYVYVMIMTLRFFHLVRSANFFAHESSDVITENIKPPLPN